jgi:predicted permease
VNETTRLIVFLAFSLLCLGLGYVARRRNWAPESLSRPIHLHTLIWFWSPVSLLTFWHLPLDERGATDLMWIMGAQPVLMIAGGGLMALLMRRSKAPSPQRGVMVLGAALSNHGFTLGAYLCYALLRPPEDALGLGIAYVTSMQVFMVLIFYPVARHYGAEPAGSLSRVMLDSFWTLRAVPLYAALIGFLLNISGLRRPDWIEQTQIIHLLFFASAAGAYGGIGLRLYMQDWRSNLSRHALLASVQFAFLPLASLALISMAITVPTEPSSLATSVILLEAFTPAAINMVIVANLFHLDARLASQLWTINTLTFIAVVLPLVIWGFYPG